MTPQGTELCSWGVLGRARAVLGDPGVFRMLWNSLLWDSLLCFAGTGPVGRRVLGFGVCSLAGSQVKPQVCHLDSVAVNPQAAARARSRSENKAGLKYKRVKRKALLIQRKRNSE